jgi:6-phosphogluconolactonase
MAPDCSDIALPMRAPGAPEPRITLTLPTLASARHTHLHIEGQAKQQVLREALSSRELPIARVLAAAGARADVHTCD